MIFFLLILHPAVPVMRFSYIHYFSTLFLSWRCLQLVQGRGRGVVLLGHIKCLVFCPYLWQGKGRQKTEMKKWSSQLTQFMQLRREAWKKFRTSTGFEPVTSRLPVRCSTNWAILFYFIISFFQASLRNCIYCVNCDDHFFILFHFRSSHMIHFIYH